MDSTVRWRWWMAAGVAMVFVGICGCVDQADSPVRWSTRRAGEFASRRLANTMVAAVQPEAVRAFQQYFRIDLGSSSGDVLVSRPAELTDRSGPEQVRDVLGRPSRRRQVAILRLNTDGPDVLVQCQVSIQRLDTAERAAFARERGDDRPTDTPIDRQGASSSTVREEWVSAGRDRKTELLILNAIQDHFTATQPTR